MVKAKKRINVDREFILRHISAYDIFKMYMPWNFDLNRPTCSPFVNEDHPSFIIGNRSDSGELIFKAFNSVHRGDCFHFVMFKYGIGYIEALQKIAQDFGLIDGSNSYKTIINSYEKPEELDSPMFLQAIPKPWTEKDKEYLAQYHLVPKDLNFCSDTKAYSTGQWSVNRQIQSLSSDEVCFYYYLKNERGEWIKVYKPYEDKKYKWRSSIPFHEMHGLSNLKGASIGFIQKSMKDGAFMAKYINPHVAIVQAEDFTAITPDNVQYIKQNCQQVYVIFDNDEKGVKACTELTNETGWGYINPPKHLLIDGITDFTDWAKHADSPQPVIEFFKQKGII